VTKARELKSDRCSTTKRILEQPIVGETENRSRCIQVPQCVRQPKIGGTTIRSEPKVEAKAGERARPSVQHLQTHLNREEEGGTTNNGRVNPSIKWI
jgi:hypothetical protein